MTGAEVILSPIGTVFAGKNGTYWIATDLNDRGLEVSSVEKSQTDKPFDPDTFAFFGQGASFEPSMQLRPIGTVLELEQMVSGLDRGVRTILNTKNADSLVREARARWARFQNS